MPPSCTASIAPSSAGGRRWRRCLLTRSTRTGSSRCREGSARSPSRRSRCSTSGSRSSPRASETKSRAFRAEHPAVGRGGAAPRVRRPGREGLAVGAHVVDPVAAARDAHHRGFGLALREEVLVASREGGAERVVRGNVRPLEPTPWRNSTVAPSSGPVELDVEGRRRRTRCAASFFFFFGGAHSPGRRGRAHRPRRAGTRLRRGARHEPLLQDDRARPRGTSARPRAPGRTVRRGVRASGRGPR